MVGFAFHFQQKIQKIQKKFIFTSADITLSEENHSEKKVFSSLLSICSRLGHKKLLFKKTTEL